MIALIDYGMGNLSSVYKAFKAVGADEVVITDSVKQIDKADAIILPGVGNFGDGVKNLSEKKLFDPIKQGIMLGKPFLGICLGMQLLMEKSEEAPGVNGLGVFEGEVVKFKPEQGLKVPQIGWNSVDMVGDHLCMEGISSGEYFYFVHSYYVVPVNKDIILGTTEYGSAFCSCIACNNVFATQFHPEKSQDAGLKILRNFSNRLK